MAPPAAPARIGRYSVYPEYALTATGNPQQSGRRESPRRNPRPDGDCVARPYRRYGDTERRTILSAAVSEDLTAREVERRFGVNPHTYYAWRRKHGLRGPRGRRPSASRR